MTHNHYIYIAVMALVSYAIRILPLTLIRKPIKNRFIQSFLYYVPYVTLAVMTFPAIVNATQSPAAGAMALVVGIAARRAGFTPFQGFLVSLLNNASAGEYAAFAIIIPPARKSRVVAALVAISFALSFLCNYLPGISALSEGTRTILLTVLISGTAAVLFPVNPDEQEAEHDA